MLPAISVKQGMEKSVSQSGLLCIGALPDSTQSASRLDSMQNIHCVSPSFSHSDILISMPGLISVGKPDYDAVEIFRERQPVKLGTLDLKFRTESNSFFLQKMDLREKQTQF